MQPRGPIIRPAARRRPTRSQLARRRGFAAFLVVLLAFGAWQFWPSDGTEPVGGATPTDVATGAPGGTQSPGTIVPGETPIEHVIFFIKENRTFDHYFGA
jgi:phospholipase C